MIDNIILLQIDSAIVAGAIILLTITSFVSKQDHEPIGIPIGKKHSIALTPHQVASGTIVGFGGSAFFILMEDYLPNFEKMALAFAVSGFVFLIISAIVIAVKEPFSQKRSEQK